MTAPILTLEGMVCGRGYADLPASPLQRAICRAAQGEPLDDVIDADTRARHFGVRQLSGERPTIVEVVAGIRSGKSFVSACAALHAALTADLSRLMAHEIPRFAIVAPRVDAATATFRLVVGIAESSAILRRFIDSEPTSDTIVIARPDGRRVEIVVVAAARGGITVRNRWLVGFVLEEVAQFGDGDAGAVVNAEEIQSAAETRLLPGCQGWLISSPYGPTGLLYQTYQKHYGNPGRTLVVHAPTRALNPTFPQAQIDAIRADQPDVAAREYDALWIDADTAYLSAVSVDACTRPLPSVITTPGAGAVAAMDPGTRANSWTLAVAWPESIAADAGINAQRFRAIVGGVWSWQGSKQTPLSPRDVLAEIGRLLAPYQVRKIHVDSWSFDAMQDHAMAAGLILAEHPATERDLPYQTLRALLGNGEVELPPDPVLRADLLSLRQRAHAGGTRIHLPRTADGRHCDYAPSVALACMHAIRHTRRTAQMWSVPSRTRQMLGGTTRGPFANEHRTGVTMAPGGLWVHSY